MSEDHLPIVRITVSSAPAAKRAVAPPIRYGCVPVLAEEVEDLLADERVDAVGLALRARRVDRVDGGVLH